MALRETLRLVEGQGAGSPSGIVKYAMVTAVGRASTATLGRITTLADSDPAVVGLYFDTPAEPIGGGPAEIQSTIVA